MTTNQTERVSDEELDQMIWKLERDGMTPKQLSLMRELREVRRAKGEPVAYMHHSGQVVTREECCDDEIFAICCKVETPLYAAPQLPQPAPEALKRLRSIVADPKTLPRRKEWISGQQYSYVLLESVEAMVDEACRAAMLQSDGTLTNEGTMQLSGNSEQLEPVSNRDELPATQFKPVSDLYGITSPTGSETSFTFDAIEAVNFIEGGWSVQEYVELERYQEAMIGNSPATPDGWIPVSEHSMLPPLKYLDIVKFNADCAIQDPESIYANEFFLSLDEVFGEIGNYSEPVQAKAVSALIAEVFRLSGYSPAAPKEVG